jgi:hypothetical protein
MSFTELGQLEEFKFSLNFTEFPQKTSKMFLEKSRNSVGKRAQMNIRDFTNE